MAKYFYTAVTKEGLEASGSTYAHNSAELVQTLSASGMVVIDVKPDTDNKKSWWVLHQHGTLTIIELADITHLFATLIDANLPIDEALLTVEKHSYKRRIKRIVHSIFDQVSQGLSLGQALQTQPNSFPSHYVATVNAGEQSGELVKVLNRLSVYLEQQVVVRRQVQTALLYPTIIFIVAFSVVALLMVFVVPKILLVIDDTGQKLPLLTQGLVYVNDWLVVYGWMAPWMLLTALLMIKVILKNRSVRLIGDRLALSTPLFGTFVSRLNTIYFCRSLAMLDSSGIPIIEALTASSSVMTNSVFKDKIDKVVNSVREGKSLHSALEQESFIPDLAMRLIASGESSGRLSQMLDKAATLMELQQKTTIRIGLTLLEPLIMVFMGGLVMLIVLAVLMPIFDMNQLVF
jgi:general secretion pathway protein F